MAIIVEPILTEGIAQLSYFVGDDSAGRAAVIDPRPDCDIYLDMARRSGTAITHIFETHIHADFMSGSRELSHRLGSVPILASHAGGAEYGFDTEPAKDGAEFEFGSIKLTVRHTPGHTPEHISLLISEADRDAPFGVFSGDTLFIDSVGRPDLLGEDQTKDLAAKLFDSIHGFYRGLDDGTIVYPGHGAGSACGPDIGDRVISTIGYEKRFNSYLQPEGEDAFADEVLSTAPPEPLHYRPMKKVNAKGPKVFGNLPPAPALPPKEFQQAVQAGGHVLLDTRDILAFGGGHIKGALNIAARPELSVWAGQLIAFDAPILLVLACDAHIDQVTRLLWRTGHTNFSGYLAGGMTAWETAGFALEGTGQLSVHDLRDHPPADLQIVDVRAPAEWRQGHLPGANHIFLPELRDRAAGELDRSHPVVTYCGSGFRAGIAASILQQEGFHTVCNLPGSMQAWKQTGYPTETAD